MVDEKATVGVVADLIDPDGTTKAKASEAAAATRAMAVEGSFMIYYGFALWE